MLSKYFLIAEVTKPQGINGEIRMRLYSDDVANMQKIGVVYTLNNNQYTPIKVEGLRIQGEFAIVKLHGIDDRNMAESLRNREIYIAREEASPLKDGEFYISDAIGANVLDTKGNSIGVLADVLTEYSRHVYVIDTSDGRILFPAISSIFVDNRLAEGTLVLDEAVLAEIGVHED